MSGILIQNIMAIDQKDLRCRERLEPNMHACVTNSQAMEVVAIGKINQGSR